MSPSLHSVSSLSLEEKFLQLSLHQTTHFWTTVDNGFSTLTTLNDTDTPSPAIFTVLGSIESSPRHVAAVHGNYRCPTLAVPSLTEARLFLTLGGKGLSQGEGKRFEQSLSFLDKVLGSCSAASEHLKSVGIRKETRLEMEHRLFQKVEDGDFPFMHRDFEDRYKRNGTAGWPVLPEAEAELHEVVYSRSHKVAPLPVLKHGVMIPPDMWAAELRPGTVVEVDFSITLRVSEKDYRNIFNARMSTVRIVRTRSSRVV
ncbi:hypothetical protein V5O48_010187 [Marasmius crinis-equi]|uniref:Uncharacterized protein n=1 Tax=Marasmius crinis-equi TaxID=585013 RepID=A0ABR3F940_9AGAR